MSGALVYVLMLGGAFATAVILMFGLRAVKLI
ncbi:MAG: cytochrome b6-f complex subunit PetL [Cyanobacteriota bacterium]|uniref:Cytochrome B6-F complex subunit VI (PetL) n=1 Tax=Zarconia navalis LEGE 11467 TaxID=1828826 RepID=A0A928VSL6_9CYAN|nr:cytochrome b6-f complex subunit PetL [Zarconia navalis]MBE9039381.1 cytochrome B6-F complex subunit VI (PetL) [Zarconia navalis LEGE 11467]MDY6940125.1 cytochrome b6-f complex subunit PetL [Cyanobacteriota bacterium]